MEKSPLYSIVMPHYNQWNILFQAIDSVLCQTYNNIQLIVIDDASLQFDANHVSAYIQQNQKGNISGCTVLQNPSNFGTTRTLNVACGHINGDFFQLFAADDLLADEHVVANFMAAFNKKNENVQIISAIALMYDYSLKIFEGDFNSYQTMQNYQAMDAKQQFIETTQRCTFPIGASCMRTALFSKFGPFDEEIKLVEDWPFWLILTRCGVKIETADFSALLHRGGGVSNSVTQQHAPHKMQYRKDMLRTQEKQILPFLPMLPLPAQLHAYRSYKAQLQDFLRLGGQHKPMPTHSICSKNRPLALRLLQDALLGFARKWQKPAAKVVYQSLLAAAATLFLSKNILHNSTAAFLFALLLWAFAALICISACIWVFCSCLKLFSFCKKSCKHFIFKRQT